MQQSIVKFYCFVVQTLLNTFRALPCPSSGAPSNCRCSLWFPYECGGRSVLSRPRTLPPPHSYGNQKLQRHFDGLLMMGMVMPETCWVSVRQSNKFYDWLLHLDGCFIRVEKKVCCKRSIWQSPNPRPAKFRFLKAKVLFVMEHFYIISDD